MDFFNGTELFKNFLKIKKKYILILLLILFIPSFVNAESVKTGKFKYMPAFKNETEEIFYYSDNYFIESGKNYNEHLVGMSLSLSLSTFEIRGSSYSKELLEELGFKDFKPYDMNEKPTLDTIGMIIAHKKLNNYNLIAVAIRGEKYDSEWGNNFIVGKEGNAKGFDDSSVKIINRIKTYIKDNKLENNKIWIVGYSRAGTIADLAGVYINDNLYDFKTTDEDLYIYTFETPASSIDKKIYDNIYTVRNKNDIIPMVYPEEWGFHINGKVINIGESYNLTTYIGLEEQVEYNSIEMQEFYRQFFSWLTSRLDRKTYSETLDEPISELLSIYFSKSNEDREKLKVFILEDIKGQILENEDNYKKIKGKVWAIFGHNSDYLYQDITNDIIDILNGLRATPNGLVLTDNEYNKIIGYIYPILRVLGPILVDDSQYYDGIDYNEYYTKQAEDYLLTDEEMGNKYGISDGKDYGYEDGLYDNPKNESSYETNSEYGPKYDEAYKTAYIKTYLEFYELGKSHKEDIIARGRYDGAKYSYSYGYSDGSYGQEITPYDEFFYKEEWMTEEYINAYNESYKEEYLKGYEEGLNNPETEDNEEYELMNFYHFATIYKNIYEIMKMHYPQENLKLIHNIDSYYSPYYLTEGANQTIDIGGEINDNLTFKTNGHIEKFIKAQVDGKDLKKNDYEIKNGTTFLTLKNSFLKIINEGIHTLKMNYIDNEIETNFTIINSKSDYEKNNGNQGLESIIKIVIESLKTGGYIMLYILFSLTIFSGLVGILNLIKNNI